MNPSSKEQVLWKRIVKNMRDREGIGEYGYDAYISKLSLIQDTGTTLLIQYPNGLPIDWVEVNYEQNIISAASYVLEAARQIEFINTHEENSETTSTSPAASKAALIPQSQAHSAITLSRATHKKTRLNPDLIFDNFIEGSSNSFAYAAANAVVNSKTKLYNPLYIHGASGLGKTHLLHAIGNAIIEKHKKKNVLYVTSEEFTNAYIEAMSKKGDSLTNFRKKYRNADVLLIDDIQFLAHKEKTQEEFFHTFNSLLSSGKQIILSSDCPASAIQTLDTRLTTRFEQGMTVSISPPSLETRIAILRHKRDQWKSQGIIDDDIINHIAHNITSCVRRLEAALIRITSYVSLHHEEITISKVNDLLRDFFQQKQKHKQAVTLENILEQVATSFQLDIDDLKSSRRTAKIAHPRQIAMYLARRHTKHSLQNISTAFGKRDHGTVLHAKRTIERKMKDDPTLRELIEDINQQLA